MISARLTGRSGRSRPASVITGAARGRPTRGGRDDRFLHPRLHPQLRKRLSAMFRDGSPGPAPDAVGRAPAAPPCIMCFPRIRLGHPCR
jgi:hypothetical protein